MSDEKTKIKKNDQVLVIAGKDRGTQGQGAARRSRPRARRSSSG